MYGSAVVRVVSWVYGGCVVYAGAYGVWHATGRQSYHTTTKHIWFANSVSGEKWACKRKLRDLAVQDVNSH